ncbi:MAG: alkaline phosphatase family protein [Cryomorphaceae bacterium]|nr:MAG: alkaline phosphatase family protein [Cryomorphaceae bacterium]
MFSKVLPALFYALFAISTALVAQNESHPKLVIGMVVDQMRYDYLTRYEAHYSENGFKRILRDGFDCRNLHYNYGPTFTGPGHASIFTGTTPRYHGIIANDWYMRDEGRTMYCSEDRSVRSVGQQSPKGQMSPRNMIATTVADELKLHSAGRSKTIAIAIKDRGATLSGGHTADAAYWMTDQWITSSFYMESLPQWVQDFNEKMMDFVPDVWEPLKPIELYIESAPDDNPWEHAFRGKDKPVFPYNLKELKQENGGINMIKSTPFGNTITTALAREAILNEQLGKGEVTDFLTVSYSSPDYLGHMLGPQAVEIQDNYMRFDLELGEFLNFLDEQFGEGNYLFFLTADHGGGWVPAQLKELGVPAGYISGKLILSAAREHITERFGIKNAIDNYSNEQFFLNLGAIETSGHSAAQIARELADFVRRFEGIAEAYTAWDFRTHEYTQGMVHLMQNGYNHKRSGDVILITEPAWMEYGSKGTTHGSPWNYDTHVPALFFGWGVKPGHTDERLSITDIAPTVSSLLRISFPNAATGKPIRAITEH